MGKIVTGLCNSNIIIEQPLVHTLVADDFIACEIDRRINVITRIGRARNAFHWSKLFTESSFGIRIFNENKKKQ